MREPPDTFVTLYGCDDYGHAALTDVDNLSTSLEQVQFLLNQPTAEISVSIETFGSEALQSRWSDGFCAAASDNHWYRDYTLSPDEWEEITKHPPFLT